MPAEPEVKQAVGAQACGWVLGFDLPPPMTVSQWADAERHIAAGTGPEPGRWRTDKSPFQREPMDAFGEPDVGIVVLQWSSQVGKTEVLINVAGYFVEYDPAPQMLVMPDLGLADSFSRSRFQPTVEASPALLARVGAALTRDGSNTLLEKGYPGGDIVFAGANSPASLASRPRRVVLFDEIDKYKLNIGKDGDPISQGIQRTQNFWNRKIGIASTPTIEGLSEINSWFKRSDQRYFEVPCPHCNAYQDLAWKSETPDGHGGMIEEPRVVWPKGQPEKAEYICRECGSAWNDYDRDLAVRAGRWRPRANFAGIAGFYLNAIYSPWVKLAELAREWESCQGEPTKEQAFVNLKLGLCYNPTQGATTTAQELEKRCEDYGPTPDGYTVPDGVLAVTCFVDVQRDRFEVMFVGWGHNDEKWVLHYVVLYRDTSDPQSFEDLDSQVLQLSFAHPLGGLLYAEAIGIDAGYLQTMVLDFVRSRRAAFRPFYAVKGTPGDGKPLWRESQEKFKAGAKLHLSGIDDGKKQLYQELAVRNDPEAGKRIRVHFPSRQHLPASFFEQLVSERVKIEIKAGRPVPSWHLPSGKRNEVLDTFVGNIAMRSSLSIDYEARRRNMQKDRKQLGYAEIAAAFDRR